MKDILVGRVYKVKHDSKGVFWIAVQFVDKEFTTGMIIEGTMKAPEAKNEKSSGDVVTVRNSFCVFKLTEIEEGEMP